MSLHTTLVRVELHTAAGRLWSLTVNSTGWTLPIAPPDVEIDGRLVALCVTEWSAGERVTLPNGCMEHEYRGRLSVIPGVLAVRFQVSPNGAVVRFRYELRPAQTIRLTRTTGADRLRYLSASCARLDHIHEVRLGDFCALTHSYRLTEERIADHEFDAGAARIGPIVYGRGDGHAALLAYEHGAATPESFLRFGLRPDRSLSIEAQHGHYHHGQMLDAQRPLRSVWFLAAALRGDADALAEAFRGFVLRHQAASPTSRAPLIQYNTWASQERDRWWRGRTFRDALTPTCLSRQIESAHRLGVEVFVIDAGWFDLAGDWTVDRARFPRGLDPVREELEKRGMKLGLWLGPNFAAESSVALASHRHCVMRRAGQAYPMRQVCETRRSAMMCLVSDWADVLTDAMIRLRREHGATYFKWDGIDRFECDDPGHRHGDASASAAERLASYGYQLPIVLTELAQRVTAACPDVTVELDLTEPGRAMGLAFLSAGKLFMLNNGPYDTGLDLPGDPSRWSNVFVRPGQARTWVARSTLGFDRWIPSTLLLTHYLPDPPRASQWVNLASLMLGHHGFWGDPQELSEDDRAFLGRWISLYKQVRDDMTEATPVRAGELSGPREIHEKISRRTGRGAVCVFSTARGRISLLTSAAVAEPIVVSHTGASVQRRPDGRAAIACDFDEPGARVILFGVRG